MIVFIGKNIIVYIAQAQQMRQMGKTFPTCIKVNNGLYYYLNSILHCYLNKNIEKPDCWYNFFYRMFNVLISKKSIKWFTWSDRVAGH